ncbi:MAG TPA: phenylalanine--tRNA ligase beta subunit-related protein [Candidatus Angelobacter sp.]|jgi:DNA/RNA-binding domain of Phe-tRNA-synthetase-like protein|nr:phenylalanine--tRNA ligase beta subunit-related protein [Candidatus Angelobacter sp.]
MSHSCLALSLEDRFLQQYPHASIHALVADGVDRLSDSVVEQWKVRAQQEVGSWRINPQRLVEEPWIQEWRTAIRQMGLNAAKKRSSVEQLCKRALAGDFISTRIPAVNLYCHISVTARAPMGGYALDRLSGEVQVRMARPEDAFIGLGERTAIAVPTGTVVYADARAVTCFAWNHRDSAHTCLESATRRAVFFADSCLPESRCRAKQAMDLLEEALREAGAVVVSRGVLDGSTTKLALDA